MKIGNSHTVLGCDSTPKIQFYHEIVSSRSQGQHEDEFGKLHKQQYYELSFFISGKRKIKVGNTIYSFNSGDIFMVSPFEEHGGSNSLTTLDRYRLHIWPTAFDGFPDKDGLLSIFDKAKYQNNKLSLTEKQQKIVNDFLFNIDNSIKLGPTETKNICALADIIKLLAFLRGVIYKTDDINTPNNKLLLDILSFIESSYDTVTAADIKKKFSLSHSTLWRLFTREIGISPSAYILETKLKKAKLLLERDIDIQTISDHCGFCDCSYFIKKFKEKYGQTPNKLKK